MPQADVRKNATALVNIVTANVLAPWYARNVMYRVTWAWISPARKKSEAQQARIQCAVEKGTCSLFMYADANHLKRTLGLPGGWISVQRSASLNVERGE